jgi:mono/diheme cytochrome c family protein
MRSPDQEQRVVMSLFNRYCIRCHGIDGRGVWDIPDVPDFTDPRWQSSRTDWQIVNILTEGRGAVMPTFRGTLALDEMWAMAHYLRTFVPGTEVSRPDVGRAAARRPDALEPAPPTPSTAAGVTTDAPALPAPNRPAAPPR